MRAPKELFRRLRTCGWEEVLQLLNGPADARSYAAAAGRLRRFGRWAEAVQLLDDMPKVALQADVVNVNATISACSAASQWQAASALLHGMRRWLQPDVVSFNAVLSACDRAAETRQALWCMASMRSSAVAPDATSYSTMMSAVARSGDWQSVLQMLEEAQQVEVRPDSVCHSVAMGAAEKASAWLVALDLFASMEQKRLPRDVVSFGNAVCATGKASYWVGTLQLLREMSHEAVELDTVLCNNCLQACANAARWQESLHLLSLMTKQNLTKTTATCNTVVRALESAGELQRAVSVLLHDFTDEPEAEWSPPSMFRTARPSQVTPQLRQAIAERLERALEWRGASPRPVVATAAPEALRQRLVEPPGHHGLEEPGQVGDYEGLARDLEGTLPEDCAGAKVQVYGSIVSRFAAADADADFSLLLEGDRHFQQRTLIEWRRNLLERGYEVSAMGMGGRVPVLTLRWGNSTADVTVGNQLGIYKSFLLREYSLLDERLCQLVLFVKRWAKLRRIYGQTRGYLGGYAWTLMAIHVAQRVGLVPSLQAAAQPELWSSRGEAYDVAFLSRTATKGFGHSASALVLGFFDYFAGFDYAKESVSIRLGCRALRARSAKGPQLSLEDPIETDWDLGQILSCERLARLRGEFRRAQRLGHQQGLKAVLRPRGGVP